MRIRVIFSLLLALAMPFLSTASFAQVGVAITVAPPALPVYEQPVCPGDGYIWTPGCHTVRLHRCGKVEEYSRFCQPLFASPSGRTQYLLPRTDPKNVPNPS